MLAEPLEPDPRPILQPGALALARFVEARLHETLGDAVPDPFRCDARLYGLTVADPTGVVADREGAIRQSFLGEAESIYDVLESPAGSMARLYDAAAVMTTGWAAPLPTRADDSRPSRHPERRRVRLVVVVDDGGVGSVLRFADDPEHAIFQPGGSGMLAEALDDVWFGSALGRVAMADITAGPRNMARKACRKAP